MSKYDPVWSFEAKDGSCSIGCGCVTICFILFAIFIWWLAN
jgi:hypothetical protein